MVKVFISQPMAGRSEDDIMANRALACNHARTLFGKGNYVVLDSMVGQTDSPLFNLGCALQVMADADAVIMAPGWDDAKGCRVEQMAAFAYDKEVYICG